MTAFALSRALPWSGATGALVVLALGCGGSPPVERAPPRGDTAVKAAVIAADGPAPACTPPLAAAGSGSAARTAAIDAFLAGRARTSLGAFEAVIRARPRDLAAVAFHLAATAKLRSATGRTSDDVAQVRPVRLAPLPRERTLVKSGRPAPSRSAMKLSRVSETKNLITDTEAWLARNGLTPATLRPRPQDLPEHVASTVLGMPAGRLFRHADHDVAVYGPTIGAFAPGKAARLFDAAAVESVQGSARLEINYAQVVGKMLLVQASLNGYAADAGGKTAYIAAYDLDEGTLLWSSEPLVANAENFVVAGEWIVSGYGFTAEPDHMFVLDLETGKTVQKLVVGSGPSFILRKGDELFVRTYDTDLVVRLEPSPGAAPAAAMTDQTGGPRAAIDPEMRCWVDRAVAAIDARDPRELASTLSALKRRSQDEHLIKSLDGVQRFLEQQERQPRALDLSTVEVVVAEPPPWEASVRAPARGEPKVPAFAKVTGGGADPVRGMRDRRVFKEGIPFSIPPVDKGRLPPGARSDIPTSYGFEDLRDIVPSGDHLILVYGGRYVAIVKGDTTEAVLDLEAYRHPPKANPQWAEFAIQDVSDARLVDGVLYVCNGGGSYAREVFGKKGFMSAIDPRSGRLLWRSEPLVCNATFGVTSDFLVTAYGFTEEPDFLFLLRRDTGKIVQRTRLDSGPTTVTVDGNRVHVEAYAHSYVFELR